MQAILTKILPATATKPTRIKASCARGSYIHTTDDSSEQSHRIAAQMLISRFVVEDFNKYGNPMQSNSWSKPYSTGQLPNGDYAHVFRR